MELALRLSLTAGVLVFWVVLFSLLRRKKLTLHYSLLWMLFGLILLILCAFPGLMTALSAALGIATPANTVFLLCLFFLLLLCLSLTSIASRQHQKIKTLIQQTALLEKRIADWEESRSLNKEP